MYSTERTTEILKIFLDLLSETIFKFINNGKDPKILSTYFTQR